MDEYIMGYSDASYSSLKYEDGKYEKKKGYEG